MKVFLSTGFGRLHLVQSATWLRRAGVNVMLVTGWIPRCADGFLVRLASKITGYNLIPGMRKRQIPEMSDCALTCSAAEFINAFLSLLARRLPVDADKVAVFCWKLYGWQSARRFKGVTEKNTSQVFHVRSGAGQGGAIATAHRLGMKVVADHSIAHPQYMEEHLRTDYEKNGAQLDCGTTSPFWRQVVRDCEEADAVLVNSDFVRETFLAQGFSPDKIYVAYQGTRPDFFGLRGSTAYYDGTRSLRLLFTGSFGFRKGAEYLMEACVLLKRKGIVFRLDVVGACNMDSALIRRYAEKINISTPLHLQKDADIVFHGVIPQDDLKSFLRESDIYVFPSLAEGCASSGLEAMAAGLCVVATRESGLPITNDVDGCLLPSRDAVALADRIVWLMKHHEAIERIGKNAATLIKDKYTWQNYAETVKRVYQKVTNEQD